MSAQTRSSETRMATGRPSIGGAPRMRLDIDVSGLPANLEPRWVRESCLGEYDGANVQDAMMDGFEPATVTMLPNANPPTLPGRPDETGGLIRRQGMILMLREKTLGEQERHYQRQEVEGQKRAAIRLSDAKPDGEQPSFDGELYVEDPENKVVVNGGPRQRAGRFKDA